MTQGFTNPFGAPNPLLSFVGPTMPNPKMVNAFSGNTASGQTDLYTVPAGRRAIIMLAQAHNTTVGAINVSFQIKISGTYYNLATTVSVTASNTTIFGIPDYVAEAGEIFAITTAAIGINMWAKIIEFDDTSTLRSAKLTSLAAGDNTLYTVTTGKSALIFNATLGSINTAMAQIVVWNNSGGTRTYTSFMVPNGGASGTSNRFRLASTVLDATISTSAIGASSCLNSGDFVVVNVDAGTATQFVFLTLCEF